MFPLGKYDYMIEKYQQYGDVQIEKNKIGKPYNTCGPSRFHALDIVTETRALVSTIRICIIFFFRTNIGDLVIYIGTDFQLNTWLCVFLFFFSHSVQLSHVDALISRFCITIKCIQMPLLSGQ